MTDTTGTPVQQGERTSSATGEWFRRNASWLALVVFVAVVVFPRVSPFEGANAVLQAPQRFGEWVLAKLEHLFADYGYYVVFLGIFLENAMFLGLLVPGSIILILAGLSAENGSISLPLVIVVAVSATLIGDTMSYLIGRLGWVRLLERAGLGEPMAKLERAMNENSRWIILAYHFAGYSRAVGPAAAGLFRVPYRRWAPLDYAGATAWVIAYAMIGVVLGLFGVEFGDTKSMMRVIEVMFTVLLVVAVVAAWYRMPKSQSRPAAVAIPVDDDAA